MATGSAVDEKWVIDKLDGSNWATWKFQMRYLLLAKGLWNELIDKLTAIGAPISEEDQVVTLLGSLPPGYATLVTALES